jgi:hypothetical protein
MATSQSNFNVFNQQSLLGRPLCVCSGGGGGDIQA